MWQAGTTCSRFCRHKAQGHQAPTVNTSSLSLAPTSCLPWARARLVAHKVEHSGHATNILHAFIPVSILLVFFLLCFSDHLHPLLISSAARKALSYVQCSTITFDEAARRRDRTYQERQNPPSSLAHCMSGIISWYYFSSVPTYAPTRPDPMTLYAALCVCPKQQDVLSSTADRRLLLPEADQCDPVSPFFARFRTKLAAISPQPTRMSIPTLNLGFCLIVEPVAAA